METFKITKIIIWGLEPNSHTHSYIHSALYKTFKHLGYETYWLPDRPYEMDYAGSLFITANMCDEHIPIRSDCLYVTHNVNSSKYQSVINLNNYMAIQVYTKDADTRPKEFLTDNPYIFGGGKCLYIHWMTNLLPDEIDEKIRNFTEYSLRDKISGFIGSINGCPTFGNEGQYQPYIQESHKNNIPFVNGGSISDDNHIIFMSKVYLAPAIQGHWQCKVGYIPCRIFKNISYGNLSGTNNETVHKLFKGKIPYSMDTQELFYLMRESVEKDDVKDRTIELMEEVRDKYTYVNWIGYMFKYFDFIRRF